jgi:hypothetical protein
MKKHASQTPFIDVDIAESHDPQRRYIVVDDDGNEDRVERITSDKVYLKSVSWRFHNRTNTTLTRVKVDFGAQPACPLDFRTGSCFGSVENLAPGKKGTVRADVVGNPGTYDYQLVVQDSQGQTILDPELQIDNRGKRGLIFVTIAAFAIGVAVGFVASGVLVGG